MGCQHKHKFTQSYFSEGYCPDPLCNERLIFICPDDTIRCNYCGQSFCASNLKFTSKLTKEEAEPLLTRLALIPHRTGPEWTRVNGLSPFLCKLISPVFTRYGINKYWKVKPLIQMAMPATFDPILLADRAFAIDEFHLNTPGYGRDESGSFEYLRETLRETFSPDSHRLEPLHVADGGYCLLLAVSRALVGREIFWHPLKEALQSHLIENKDWYKNILEDFITVKDWRKMIKQDEKDFERHKDNFLRIQFGLIFALSNVLHRPIILLDASKSEDGNCNFSFTFLPVLRNSEQCKNKDGELNKPIVLGWADRFHVRIVPLVAIQDLAIPKIRKSNLPKIWAIENAGVENYIEFDDDQFCEVACGRIMRKRMIVKMIKSMEKVYQELFGVNPQMLSDFCEDVMEFQTFSSSTVDDIILDLIDLSNDYKLFRCLICWRLIKMAEFPQEYLNREGFIYQKMKSLKAEFVHGEMYILFPIGEFWYNGETDSLKPSRICMYYCPSCTYFEKQLRHQFFDGNINYMNGDHTRTPCLSSLCPRKMEHFWEQSFYDNSPTPLEVNLNYNGKNVYYSAIWFRNESNPEKNSNAHEIAMRIIDSYFSDISQCFTSDQFKIVLEDLTEHISQIVSNHKLCCRFSVCGDHLWRLSDGSHFVTLTHEELEYRTFIEKQMKNASFQFTGRQCTDEFNLPNGRNESRTKQILQQNQPQKSIILLSDGRKLLLFAILMELKDTIANKCRMQIEDIVAIYHGYPATKLQLNDHLYLLEDNTFVQLKEKMAHFGNRTKNENETVINVYDKIYNKLMMQKLSSIYLTLIGSKYFWNYLEDNPTLFKNNGDIYWLIKSHVKQLKNNDHFRLPYFFANETLVYNEEKDRIELCIPDFDHIEINKETQKFPYEFLSSLAKPTTSVEGTPNDVIAVVCLCQKN